MNNQFTQCHQTQYCDMLYNEILLSNLSQPFDQDDEINVRLYTLFEPHRAQSQAINQYDFQDDLDDFKILHPWQSKIQTPKMSPRTSYVPKKFINSLIFRRGHSQQHNQDKINITNKTAQTIHRKPLYDKLSQITQYYLSKSKQTDSTPTLLKQPDLQPLYKHTQFGIAQDKPIQFDQFSEFKKSIPMNRNNKRKNIPAIPTRLLSNNFDKNSYNEFYTHVHKQENKQRLMEISQQTQSLMRKTTSKYDTPIVIRQDHNPVLYLNNTIDLKTQTRFGLGSTNQPNNKLHVEVISQKEKTKKKLLKKNIYRIINKHLHNNQDSSLVKWSYQQSQ